ncbi:MAG: glycosyl transferase, partial [Bacteroidia bacterium]
MKLNFCTLFNSNYLSRGLVMYESLLKNCADFHLYVFAFDDKCFEFLNAQKYKNLTVISLKEFEDEELLKIKLTRSAAEYCWTCTASTILYSINNFGLSNCTYVDADMCFYSDPQVLIDEMGDKSVLITEHRYTKEYDQSATSGKYCVQFVTFKNDEKGLAVLKWWRNACIDWCYDRMEDGKFGDQKYLDDWTTRFDCVHELQHLGGGIAPWNVQQYIFNSVNGKLTGTEIKSGKQFNVIFYHFHAAKFFRDNMVMLTGAEYALNKNVKNVFYKPYVQMINKQKEKINAIDKSGMLTFCINAS